MRQTVAVRAPPHPEEESYVFRSGVCNYLFTQSLRGPARCPLLNVETYMLGIHARVRTPYGTMIWHNRSLVIRYIVIIVIDYILFTPYEVIRSSVFQEYINPAAGIRTQRKIHQIIWKAIEGRQVTDRRS